MKNIVISLLLSIAITAQLHAQNLVQNLSVSLQGFNTQNQKLMVITTSDVIRYFIGTNVSGGQLQLVTPTGNPPGTVGNLNAFLRVRKNGTTLVEVPSPDNFNLFQDAAVHIPPGYIGNWRAINRFSIDFAYLHAELQGYSIWTIGNTLSGSGSFTSSVNGYVTVDGVTLFSPMHGTITASAPKLE
jgi:hypothetical protein